MSSKESIITDIIQSTERDLAIERLVAAWKCYLSDDDIDDLSVHAALDAFTDAQMALDDGINARVVFAIDRLVDAWAGADPDELNAAADEAATLLAAKRLKL